MHRPNTGSNFSRAVHNMATWHLPTTRVQIYPTCTYHSSKSQSANRQVTSIPAEIIRMRRLPRQCSVVKLSSRTIFNLQFHHVTLIISKLCLQTPPPLPPALQSFQKGFIPKICPPHRSRQDPVCKPAVATLASIINKFPIQYTQRELLPRSVQKPRNTPHFRLDRRTVVNVNVVQRFVQHLLRIRV